MNASEVVLHEVEADGVAVDRLNHCADALRRAVALLVVVAVAATFNSRSRKTLGWKTPAEALADHLCSIAPGGVATTP
jgi:hypothetical protein